MPYKTELLVKSPSGEMRSVVIGIPEDQFLKLKAEYPDKGFSGHNPKVDVAIKEGITEDEKQRIAIHLGLPRDTRLELELKGGILRYIDEDKPSFESNGRKFWIKPKQP